MSRFQGAELCSITMKYKLCSSITKRTIHPLFLKVKYCVVFDKEVKSSEIPPSECYHYLLVFNKELSQEGVWLGSWSLLLQVKNRTFVS